MRISAGLSEFTKSIHQIRWYFGGAGSRPHQTPSNESNSSKIAQCKLRQRNGDHMKIEIVTLMSQCGTVALRYLRDFRNRLTNVIDNY